MTIHEVQDICFSIAAEHGYVLNTQISANGRFKTTLGRVSYSGYGIEKIEFSKYLLEHGSYEEIMNTIKHELAHAFVYLDTGKTQKHNAIFKAKCYELGLDENGAAAVSKVETAVPQAKYSIYCVEENKIIAYRHRACKVTAHPELYACPHCQSNIKVVQNY